MAAEDNLSYQEPASIPYLVFLYKDQLRAQNQVMVEPEQKYEIKYSLTDELVHTNFSHVYKFTPVEVEHMQDSVIYKKRLRLTIANIRKLREKNLKKTLKTNLKKQKFGQGNWS